MSDSWRELQRGISGSWRFNVEYQVGRRNFNGECQVVGGKIILECQVGGGNFNGECQVV